MHFDAQAVAQICTRKDFVFLSSDVELTKEEYYICIESSPRNYRIGEEIELGIYVGDIVPSARQGQQTLTEEFVPVIWKWTFRNCKLIVRKFGKQTINTNTSFYLCHLLNIQREYTTRMKC